MDGMRIEEENAVPIVELNEGAPPEATPMMRQYIEIRAANPDSLLFYRMGDFYELFFDDAVEAARALGIHLTKRGKHMGADIPMCGVPVATADDYLQKLIALGYRVAVCEQLEDPSEAKKRGSKSVVRRDVVRLVTPGTVTEEKLLDPTESRPLAALSRVRSSGADEYALAWIDLSTGLFRVAGVPFDRLEAEIARIAPAELIVPQSLWSDTSARNAFDGLGLAIQPQDASCFDVRAAPERLQRVLGVATLDAFGAFTPGELSALGAVAGYVEATQRDARPALSPPIREALRDHMLIDAATRASLELDRGPDGGRVGSLLAAIDRTLTGGGARCLAARLRAPLTDPGRINARLEAVAWFMAHDDVRDGVRGNLRGTPDLERATSRLALDRGRPLDLLAVRDGLRVANRLADRLPPEMPDELADARTALGEPLGDLVQILDALSDRPPARAGEPGLVREGASTRLDDARALIGDSRRAVMALQTRYAEQTGVRTLRIKHNNVLGYFIEVNSNHADALGKEPFRHRQTLASAMRFTCDELQELEGRIASAAEDARQIEAEAFKRMRDAVVEAAPRLRALAGALATIDVSAALARLAEGEGYCRPVVDDTLAFEIVAGRHPVVEQALRASASMPFVANDAALSAPKGQERGALWLLTGPNMGGKSTFLRQCALIAVMAQAGSFVPAGSARIGVVDRLFSRVGASDDLARGRSTFMVEMVETATILHQATERSLVVLDEIGRGTSTHDGLSIAWSAVEHLHEAIGPRGLFATHFHELTALEGRLDRLACVHCRVEEAQGEVVFLHEIAPGAASRSYGIQVAKLAGLPAPVVARAKAVLERLEGHARARADRARQGGSPKSDAPCDGRGALDDLPLFSLLAVPEPANATDPLREALTEIAPDEMTPREAMDALYRLKSLR